MKILIAILTTSDVPRARRAVETAKAQVDHYFAPNVVVFSNSTDESYFAKLVDGLEGTGVQIVHTKSDGTPGTGKQSVINWFMAHEEYDAFVLVDGDDFLYPCALSVIGEIVEATAADVLGLESHDMLCDHNPDLKKMQVDKDHWLIGWYGQQIHHVAKRDRNDRFKNVGEVRTPDRLIWYTRKAFRDFIRPWFTDGIGVYEDYVASLTCLAGHVNKCFRYVQIDTGDIYVVDSTKRDSTCTRHLSAGGSYGSVNDKFQELIKPIDLLIGDHGFEATIFYEYPHEGRLTHTQRVDFVRDRVIVTDEKV